jgi:hypothetical protein
VVQVSSLLSRPFVNGYYVSTYGRGTSPCDGDIAHSRVVATRGRALGRVQTRMREWLPEFFFGNTVAFLPGEVYTSPIVRFVAGLTG